MIYIYIQETDNEAFFIKAYHSLCLGLESLPCLPGLLLCCCLLVAVNQNPDEPQLQEDDQHVHHYLGNHRRQLRCRCGGHSHWIMSHVGFDHARSGCLRFSNDLSKAFHVKLLTLNVKSGRFETNILFQCNSMSVCFILLHICVLPKIRQSNSFSMLESNTFLFIMY